MPLTEDQSLQNDNGSEWFGHEFPNDPQDAPTLWDLRHVALEAEFANAANIWITKKQNPHDWLRPSPESHKVLRNPIWCAAKQYSETVQFACPEIRIRAEGLRVEFETLARQWHRDTRHLSQISKQITHPAFLRIIGMGEAAIPLILEALRDKPAHWFTALRATANTDPSQPDDPPSQAREAWIAWGVSRGYID
jgi:hypothetical protein